MLKIILMTYENRSGSTLVARNLSSDKIVCCPESDVLMQIILSGGYLGFEILQDDYKFKEWEISDSLHHCLTENLTYQEALARLLSEYVRKVNPLAEYVLIKGTDYLFIDALATEKLNNIFGDVIMLKVTRDPISIYNSQVKSIHSSMKVPMENNAVQFYLRIQRRILYKEFISRVIIVEFEDYIMDVSQGNSRILSELKLDADDFRPLEYRIGKSQAHLHKRKIIDLKNGSRQLSNISFIDRIVLQALIDEKIKSRSRLLIPYIYLCQMQWKYRILKKYFSLPS